LLITDVQMPGMSGVALQDHLTANGHSTPVIFVTAYPEESVRARALDAGAFGFLSKPFTEESLIECLGRALEHYRPKPEIVDRWPSGLLRLALFA